MWPININEQVIDNDITVSCESVSRPEAYLKVYKLVVRQFELNEDGLRAADVIRSAKVTYITYTQRILYVA